MNILVTGRGSGGSWAIRGEQLGHALGAHVEANAASVAGYDVVVVVKKIRPEGLAALHKAGVPIVYDIVDAWPQPDGNGWSREECLSWLRMRVQEIRPAAIVAATRRMAEDCEQFGLPVRTVPHHARPWLPRNAVREKVQRVGYEGSEAHLGAWSEVIGKECSRRGWSFVINAPHLAELDIVVAMREADGYAPRNWKSNVKLANAQGSGTPCVLNMEAGYVETASGGECWAETANELAGAFDALSDHKVRRLLSAELIGATIRLDDVAASYKEWIERTFC